MSETEIIHILDDGVIKLIEKKARASEGKLDVILEDIKERYDYTLKKLAEQIIKMREETQLYYISID